MRILIGLLAAGLCAQTVVINPPGGGGGGGAVSSVFTRTGAVVAGTGDYTAAQVTNAADTTGSYSNPGWITALAGAKITGIVAGNEVPLTFSGPLSRTVNTVACVVATGSVPGCLAAADWTTFNGKQSALGFTPLNPANNLSEVTAATARTNLGLAAVAASGSATDLGSGTLGAARMPNAGVHTGDVSGTFPATLVKQIHETLTSVNFAASPYTVLAADSYIYCDATAGAVVINLPATSGSGREISVKKIDATANACTLTRAGSDVIDAATTAALSTQYVAAKVADRATGFWDRTHVNQLVGDVTGASTANAVKSLNGTLLSGLGTGLLKNTTGTGIPSIAVAADVPVIPLATGVSGTLAAAQFPALTGDVTTSAGSLGTTVAKIGGNIVTLGGALTTSGAFATTLTTTGATSVTLPTSGTLAILAANTFTALQTVLLPALAAATADAALLTNTTAAAVGAQQVSPALDLCGQGWKTTATAASQSVCFHQYTLPVQGAANPTGQWNLEASVNSGAFVPVLAATSSGLATVQSAGNAQLYLDSFGATGTSGAGFIYSGGSSSFGWQYGNATSGTLSTEGIHLLNPGVLAWGPTLSNGFASGDVMLQRDAAGILSVSSTAAGTTAANYRDFKARHLLAAGTAPTITSGFGTSPSIAGFDTAGRLTVGTGGVATTGVITFGTAYTTNAPACTANNETTVALVQATATTTTLTLTAASAFAAGALLTWHCTGY